MMNVFSTPDGALPPLPPLYPLLAPGHPLLHSSARIISLARLINRAIAWRAAGEAAKADALLHDLARVLWYPHAPVVMAQKGGAL